MVSYERFHDGLFDGFLIDGKSVHVFLSTDQQEKYVLTASAVTALAADRIQVGNIILDIEERAPEELTLRDIRDVFRYQERPEDEVHANNALLSARKAGLFLLAINPSYGGSCLLLAKSFKLLPRRKWSGRHSAVSAASVSPDESVG